MSDTEEKEGTSGHSKGGKGALKCPVCGAQTFNRIPRKGFMQRVIYARFGYYPWKCSACKATRRIKSRGVRRQRSSDT